MIFLGFLEMPVTNGMLSFKKHWSQNNSSFNLKILLYTASSNSGLLYEDIICGGGAEGGEIQHSETRLFLFGINFQSITLPKAQGLLVFLACSFHF